MSYYDNVKDNVKDNKGDSAGKPSFDTLKEEAEKTSVEEDEEAETDDGTPIEVLEEGGLRQQSSQSQQSNQNQSNSQSTQSQNQQASSQSSSQPVQQSSSDRSSVEQKLDKLIEQNEKIIEVLESFGQ